MKLKVFGFVGSIFVAAMIFGPQAGFAECVPTEVVIKEVPFPKGTEIEFPWSSISGEWHTDSATFRITKGATDANGRRYMKVEELDAETKQPISEGVAVLRRGSKIASGLLSNESRESFVILRSFKDKNAQGIPNGKSILVITIRNLESANKKTCDEVHRMLLKGSL
jgi:hypothetical protein